MTQKEMKKEPYVFTITGILCLFNIPIILLLTLNNYSIWHIIFLILISLTTQFCLSTYISNLLYFHYKSIVENLVKIEPSSFIKKIKIIRFIMFLGVYFVLLYLFTQKSINIQDVIPLLNIMNLIYFPWIINQGNFQSYYIGDENFVYGNTQVKIEDIGRYEIKTIKKYTNGKSDKIQLIIFTISGKEIVVFNSSCSYKLIEALDKVFEKRYVDEKMKEYGLQ